MITGNPSKLMMGFLATSFLVAGVTADIPHAEASEIAAVIAWTAALTHSAQQHREKTVAEAYTNFIVSPGKENLTKLSNTGLRNIHAAYANQCQAQINPDSTLKAGDVTKDMVNSFQDCMKSNYLVQKTSTPDPSADYELGKLWMENLPVCQKTHGFEPGNGQPTIAQAEAIDQCVNDSVSKAKEAESAQAYDIIYAFLGGMGLLMGAVTLHEKYSTKKKGLDLS